MPRHLKQPLKLIRFEMRLSRNLIASQGAKSEYKPRGLRHLIAVGRSCGNALSYLVEQLLLDGLVKEQWPVVIPLQLWGKGISETNLDAAVYGKSHGQPQGGFPGKAKVG
jgi:hypothetical protein